MADKNVIDLKAFLKKRPLPAFDGITEDQAMEAINFFWEYLQMEIQYGLGLIDFDSPDAPDIEDLHFFNKIEEFYEATEGDCYFCDSHIDPLDTPYDPRKTPLCMMCRQKLANFVQALGLDPGKIFKNKKPNPEQPQIFKTDELF
jgi:hypothetical protein